MLLLVLLGVAWFLMVLDASLGAWNWNRRVDLGV